MTTSEQIQALQRRQLALKAVMLKSDVYAAKCTKLGLSFAETYPEKAEEYKAANEEYNENEELIIQLEFTAQDEAEAYAQTIAAALNEGQEVEEKQEVGE